MPLKSKLKLPKKLWTKADTQRLAMNTLASIKLRTSEGIDANGVAFKKYSTKPIYIPIGRGTGARLKPKGGERRGDSMFFQGGYREYKHRSRKRGSGGDSAEVDLVLSGILMNNLVVLQATQNRFVIGLTQHVQYYGYYVNETREYLGLTQKDVNILYATVEAEIARKLNSGRKP